MKKNKRRESKPILYPTFYESGSKIFHIKSEKKLSSVAKLILNSFKNKYLYYAMDDISYSFELNSKERDNLLEILKSLVLSLQNNFYINFFDIWIYEIYINEVSKVNKFLKNDLSNLEQGTCITIKLLYKMPISPKKLDSLW